MIKETSWFENEVKVAEQSFREEQAAATERLLVRHRQIMEQALKRNLLAQANVHRQPSSMLPSPLTHQMSDSDLSDSDQSESEDEQSFFSQGPNGKHKARNIEAYSDDPRNCMQKCLRPIVNSPAFEIVSITFVILYSIVLGIEVHLDITQALETKSNIAEPIVKQLLSVFTFLVFAYCVEMFFRLAAEQRDFCRGENRYWNLFDVIVLAMSILDFIVTWRCEGAKITLLSEFRVLRFTRLIRILRIVRLFKYFADLRILLWSVVSCFSSFFWAMLLMFITFYVFAIFLEDAATVTLTALHGELSEKRSLGENEFLVLDSKIKAITAGLKQHWDGMYCGMLSLTFSISGGDDWANIGAPFFDMNVFYGCIFTGVIFVSLFGITNVLVGIFVQKAGEIEKWDRDLALQTTDTKHETRKKTYKELFNEIDTDKSGKISVQELQKHFEGQAEKDRRVLLCFRHLGIDVDARTIIHAFDKNNDGYLSLQEFEDGCRKLQGAATSAQLEHLTTKVDEIMQIQQEEFRRKSTRPFLQIQEEEFRRQSTRPCM